MRYPPSVHSACVAGTQTIPSINLCGYSEILKKKDRRIRQVIVGDSIDALTFLWLLIPWPEVEGNEKRIT